MVVVLVCLALTTPKLRKATPRAEYRVDHPTALLHRDHTLTAITDRFKGIYSII